MYTKPFDFIYNAEGDYYDLVVDNTESRRRAEGIAS